MAKEEEAKAQKAGLAAQFQREQMVQRQRKIREDSKLRQEERWLAEEKVRAARTPKGIRGLWGWITGKNRQIRTPMKLKWNARRPATVRRNKT